MRAYAIMFLVACSGGGEKRLDPPQNKFGTESKVADTMKIGEVAGADEEKLCEQLYALKEPEMIVAASCLIAGIGAAEGKTDAELRTSCKREAEICMKNPKAPSAACLLYDAKKTNCKELTVGQLRACMKASGALVTKFANSDPCNALTAANERERMAPILAMMKTPECDVFETCDVSTEGDADFQERAVVPVEKFKAQVCACADKVCALKVDDEFRLWDAVLELPSDAKPNPQTEKRLTDTLAAYRACLGKLAPERNKQ